MLVQQRKDRNPVFLFAVGWLEVVCAVWFIPDEVGRPPPLFSFKAAAACCRADRRLPALGALLRPVVALRVEDLPMLAGLLRVLAAGSEAVGGARESFWVCCDASAAVLLPSCCCCCGCGCCPSGPDSEGSREEVRGGGIRGCDEEDEAFE